MKVFSQPSLDLLIAISVRRLFHRHSHLKDKAFSPWLGLKGVWISFLISSTFSVARWNFKKPLIVWCLANKQVIARIVSVAVYVKRRFYTFCEIMVTFPENIDFFSSAEHSDEHRKHLRLHLHDLTHSWKLIKQEQKIYTQKYRCYLQNVLRRLS